MPILIDKPLVRLLVVLILLPILVVCFGGEDGIEGQQGGGDAPSVADRDGVLSLYAAVLELIRTDDSIDTYVAVRNAAGELVDPERGLFSGRQNVYPFSVAKDFEFPGKIVSHTTGDQAELIIVDILRLEPRRAYVLVDSYRRGLDADGKLVVLTYSDKGWIVATECEIWIA